MLNPMLSAKASSTDQLKFPVMASPKIDGNRAVVEDGVLLMRSLKPVPNHYIQKLFGLPQFNGLDGELVVGSPTAADVCRKTSSAVSSHEGEPDVTFYVFDDRTLADRPFSERFHALSMRLKRMRLKRVVLVPHYLIMNGDLLIELESDFLAQGYEGVMVRDPDGRYKSGRSTLKEAGLVKVKRFEDGEAKIIGFNEELHNANEAKTNALGQKERSSHKANKVGKGTLGSFKAKDLKTGVEFEVGSGISAEDKKTFWARREELMGKLIKYKFFPVGVKEKPRHPVFLSFRDTRDMS